MLLNTLTHINCARTPAKKLDASVIYNVFGFNNDKIEMKQTRLTNNTRSTYIFTSFLDETFTKDLKLIMRTEYWLKKGSYIMDTNQTAFYRLGKDVKISVNEAKFVLSFDNKKAMVRKTSTDTKTKTKIKNKENNAVTEVASNSILYFFENKYSVIGAITDNFFRDVKIEKSKDLHLLLKKDQSFEYLGPYEFDKLPQGADAWEFMYLDTNNLNDITETVTTIDLKLCYWMNFIKLDSEVEVTQVKKNEQIQIIKKVFEDACTEIKDVCELITSHLDKDMEQEELKKVVSSYQRLKNITRCLIFKKDASNTQTLEQLSSRLMILYGFAIDAFAKNLEYDYESVETSYTQFAYREFTELQNPHKDDLAKTYIIKKSGFKFSDLSKKWHDNIFLFNVTLDARNYLEINPPTVDNTLIKEDISSKIQQFKEKYQNDLEQLVINETMGNAAKQLFNEIKAINDELLELVKRYYVSGIVIDTISKRLQKTQEKYFDSDILCYSIIKELLDAQRNKYEILRKIKDIRNKPTFIEDLVDNAEMKISEIDNVINTRLTDNEILVKLKSLSECIMTILQENKDKLSQEDQNIEIILKTKIGELENYIPNTVDNDNLIKRLITEAKEKIREIDNVIKDKKVNENDLITLKDKCNEIIKNLNECKGNLKDDEENTKQELQEGIVKLTKHIEVIVLLNKSITVLIQEANTKISEIDSAIKNKGSNKRKFEKLKTDGENIMDVLKQKENEFDDANKGKETMSKLQEEIKNLDDHIDNLIKSINTLIKNAEDKMIEIDLTPKNKELNKERLENLKKKCEEIIVELKKNKDNLDGKNVDIEIKLQDQLDKLTDYINNLKEEIVEPKEHELKQDDDSSGEKDGSKLSTGALIGIILGGIAGILIFVIVIWMFYKKRGIVDKEMREILGDGEITVVSKSSFYRI